MDPRPKKILTCDASSNNNNLKANSSFILMVHFVDRHGVAKDVEVVSDKEYTGGT